MPYKGQDRWFNPKHAVADDSTYMDWSDAKALVDQMYIDFYDANTENSIAFKAYITDYSETYEAAYSGDQEFKNIDYVFQNFKKTVRRINLGWKTVAASLEEAKENMQRASEFIRMGYGKPNPGSDDEPTGMAVKVRFSNWLVDPENVGQNPGAFAPADDTGLKCEMSNIQYSPDLEFGSFDTHDGVFPKVINLNCSLMPIQNVKGKVHNKFPFGYKGLKTDKEKAPPNFRSGEEGKDEESKARAELLLRGTKT